MVQRTSQPQSNPAVCKHCQSENVRKYGRYKDTQLYFCDNCHRKFTPNASLFHMKTPAKQVSSALQQFYDGLSIRDIQRHLEQEYGNRPSVATIYGWIKKYTGEAVAVGRDYHPQVGSTWVCDETVLKIDKQNVWLFDVIDSDTRFLLSTRLSSSRTQRDAQLVMDRAIKKAGKAPKTVVTDKLAAYLDVNYGKGAEHEQGGPFNIEANTNLIERFHGTLKDRTKVMRGLKDLESAHEFLEGWLVHYNYLRNHEALGHSPAREAKIDYPFNDWADVIRMKEPRVKVLHTPAVIEIVKVPTRRATSVPIPKRKRVRPTLSPHVYESHGVLSHRRTRGSKRLY